MLTCRHRCAPCRQVAVQGRLLLLLLRLLLLLGWATTVHENGTQGLTLRCPSHPCFLLQERFQAVAVGMKGFTWRAERPEAATFVDQKWGYSANCTGAGGPHARALTVLPGLSRLLHAACIGMRQLHMV